ncbi:N-terminal double-transmembrane domain-containing protein [Lishizhenia tianjinensis]|uniref:N-terminal double-transmembrane domain-containing protein n=1 Tax=Lishizhenia tianjinensis TaxID=477690 RepID=A0A1I6YI88_9FLAO|nr:BatA domain-containing protein [Lishizhenia tianjinensis]SFT50130.1 N-terminal double-transmembrane domain-containing protein [Lishizhenia tianjinensis]
MKFANPAFLYALGVLALPILIHLFNFRRYKTLYFSSLRFLKNVEEKTRSTQKVKHLIILLLRCFAFICLVLAFAQPYIPLQENVVNTKSFVQAIYIDNSLSMQAMGMQGELLSEAKESAKSIIQEAKPNTEFIILTNSLSGVERRLINKNDALDRVDNIRQIPERKDLKDVISLHKEIVQQKNADGMNQLIVLSDFQENQSNVQKTNADSSTYYQFIQLQAQNTENIYIDSVWFNSPLRKINRNNELNVRIQNKGETDLKNVELKLVVGDYNRNMLVDINAKESTTKTFNYTDNTPGMKSGYVEVNDQQIFFDDKFYFAYTVRQENKVLIINTNTSLENPAWVYDTDDYYTYKTVLENQVQREDILSADLVVLNGLNTISSGQVALLTEYVQQGGSLCILPGTSINTQNYNQLLSGLKMPSLAPLKDNDLALTKLNLEDLFFDGIFQQKPTNISLPEVYQYYPILSNTAFNAIDLVSFQNNSPYFVKSKSPLKVYLFAAPLPKEYSKLISHSLFSTFLLRIGELAQRSNPMFSTLGESSVYRMRLNGQSDKAIHLLKDKIDFIPPTTRDNNYVELNLDNKAVQQTLNDGIYSIYEEKELGKLALNYNRLESDLKVADLEQIEIQLKANGASKVNISSIVNAEEIAQLDLEKPQTYWRILLFLSLVFLILEMIVIRTKIFK